MMTNKITGIKEPLSEPVTIPVEAYISETYAKTNAINCGAKFGRRQAEWKKYLKQAISSRLRFWMIPSLSLIHRKAFALITTYAHTEVDALWMFPKVKEMPKANAASFSVPITVGNLA